MTSPTCPLIGSNRTTNARMEYVYQGVCFINTTSTTWGCTRKTSSRSVPLLLARYDHMVDDNRPHFIQSLSHFFVFQFIFCSLSDKSSLKYPPEDLAPVANPSITIMALPFGSVHLSTKIKSQWCWVKPLLPPRRHHRWPILLQPSAAINWRLFELLLSVKKMQMSALKSSAGTKWLMWFTQNSTLQTGK